ncbi:hypothetical protein GDO81_022263 [Engystomops pustulosus]|uniref:Uncharacterized protein n=1 Tax=Engystomops pustulosus TaxID=76066 RepID=A0AAV6YMJ5_ENGPU|nr:hypothetical protein GDO81_022263 [Engystomops pustulosus]
MKCAALVSRSTTTRRVSLPLDGGRSTMKSIDIEPQGREGTAKGCNKPVGEERGVLHLAQISQDLTYFLTSPL